MNYIILLYYPTGTFILSYRVQSRVKGQHRKMGLTEYWGVLTGACSAQ